MQNAVMLALVIYVLIHLLSIKALKGLSKWRIITFRGVMAMGVVSVIVMGDVAASALPS